MLALPVGSGQVRGLARAAMALDAASAVAAVERSLDRVGVIATWEELVSPVLHSVGSHWEATGEGVEVEHLLAESVIEAMHAVMARLRSPVNPRPVLLASAEGEMHSLPLYALAAALAERSVSSRVLGARLPREGLAAAVRRSGPAAVFVWSQVRGHR